MKARTAAGLLLLRVAIAMVAVAVRPLVAPDRHGRTQLGFTVRLPR